MPERLRNFCRAMLREQSGRAFAIGAELVADAIEDLGERAFVNAARRGTVGWAMCTLSVGIAIVFDLKPEDEPPIAGEVVVNFWPRDRVES